MPINTRECYIEIGTKKLPSGELENALKLPVPTGLPSSNEFLVDAQRNANGSLMLQQIGRTQYTTQIKWARLPNRKWWEINRWFERYGYVFYMKYFSHTDGRVKISRFYRGNVEKGEPSSTTEVMQGYAVPTSYTNCGFSIIDTGEAGVETVAEMEVI